MSSSPPPLPPPSGPRKIAIIGGGAAGFFAAINAAQHNARSQPQESARPEIHIFEANRHFLQKVKISGGGRCNVTHHQFSAPELIGHYPRGSRELRSVFHRFGPKQTWEWFESHGVPLKVEKDQRIFPQSDNSHSIIACFLNLAEKLKVHLHPSSPVSDISKNSDQSQFILTVADRELAFDKVCLTTGGAKVGHRLLQKLGHHLVAPIPSLFTFKIAHPLLSDLSGLSVQRVELSLKISSRTFRTQGPLLITHWGLSGPAVIKLSALAARELHQCQYQAALKINWMPPNHPQAFEQMLAQMRQSHPRHSLNRLRPPQIPKRLWERFLGLVEIQGEQRVSEIGKRPLNQLAQWITQSSLPIHGKSPFKEEFVTCGGVKRQEIDFKSMESKLLPNLYFAGEVLDIDGLTGGFNFQNAWSTAWLASHHLH